jgi:hypothetical protein
VVPSQSGTLPILAIPLSVTVNPSVRIGPLSCGGKMRRGGPTPPLPASRQAGSGASLPPCPRSGPSVPWRREAPPCLCPAREGCWRRRRQRARNGHWHPSWFRRQRLPVQRDQRGARRWPTIWHRRGGQRSGLRQRRLVAAGGSPSGITDVAMDGGTVAAAVDRAGDRAGVGVGSTKVGDGVAHLSADAKGVLCCVVDLLCQYLCQWHGYVQLYLFFSTFFLSPIFVYFAEKVNPRCLC